MAIKPVELTEISEAEPRNLTVPDRAGSNQSGPNDAMPKAAPAPRVRTKGSSQLRRMLVMTDSIALLIGWIGTSLVAWYWADLNRPISNWVLVMTLGFVSSHVIMRSRGLYMSRVTSIRAVEAAKVTTSLAMSSVGTYVVLSPFEIQRTVTGYEVILIFLFSSLFVVVGRGFYQNWLTGKRAEGTFARDVIVLGSNREAKDLIDVLEHNPGLGYNVTGVLGYPGQAGFVGIDVERLMIGSIENVELQVAQKNPQGVIVVESAIAEADRREIVQRLLRTGVHVQITGGVRGVDQRRVHAHPLADSSIMYLEPTELHRWQMVFKRGLDVAVSGAILAISSPFILLGAIAVKAYDRGPSFQCLKRVDQAGRTYGVWTLRTTVAGIDIESSDLTEAEIQQRDSEMYRPQSLWSDPHRTPVGRVLEATCINELPQLLSVLVGTTSLVGHRPTWAGDPNASTDGTHLLRPGLTGLWRVETRYSNGHNDFLDDYYLENWSVTLDLVILLATLDKALLRLVHGESWRREDETDSAQLLALRHGIDPAVSEVTSVAS